MTLHRQCSIEHYSDVTMGAMASQNTSLTIVYITVYSGADQRKHQSSASLAFVRGIHRWPVNSPHKWPVTRKMFPFDDVIMECVYVFNQKSYARCIMNIRVNILKCMDERDWNFQEICIVFNRKSTWKFSVIFQCIVGILSKVIT